MDSAKYAIKNSLGQYAGAGTNVILQLDSGQTVKGKIKAIQYANIVVLENDNWRYSVNHIVDFRII